MSDPTSAAKPGLNDEQIRLWNEQSGPRWVAQQERLDAQLAPFGEEAMKALGATAENRILDVGCGCGDTTLALARRTGAAVTGVDVSHTMLVRARERLAHDGFTNVSFVEADAQTYAFEPGSFDRLVSRFGVMFFADPPAAFANLRRALAPGARLSFVCWQAMERNAWLTVPLQAALAHVPAPAPTPPGAPGPFAFADESRVRALLAGAGFADVRTDPFETELSMAGGGTLDDAVTLASQVGPAAVLLRENPDKRDAIVGAVREAFARRETDRGVLLPAAVWVVTARAE